jgi:hypothetical protein
MKTWNLRKTLESRVTQKRTPAHRTKWEGTWPALIVCCRREELRRRKQAGGSVMLQIRLEAWSQAPCTKQWLHSGTPTQTNSDQKSTIRSAACPLPERRGSAMSKHDCPNAEFRFACALLQGGLIQFASKSTSLKPRRVVWLCSFSQLECTRNSAPDELGAAIKAFSGS